MLKLSCRLCKFLLPDFRHTYAPNEANDTKGMIGESIRYISIDLPCPVGRQTMLSSPANTLVIPAICSLDKITSSRLIFLSSVKRDEHLGSMFFLTEIGPSLYIWGVLSGNDAKLERVQRAAIRSFFRSSFPFPFTWA